MKIPPFVQIQLTLRTGYGLSTCSAHDLGKPPYCYRGPPSWCADSWCYVDRSNCDKPASKSVFFPGLYYSYLTCGNANTFNAWFGEPEPGGTTHQLTELVDLMENYTRSISETLEENYLEAKQVRLTTSPPPSIRPRSPPPYHCRARMPPADGVTPCATRRRAALPRARAPASTAIRPGPHGRQRTPVKRRLS